MVGSALATVLIVEDDPGIAELERVRLEDAGYAAVVAATAEDALRAVGEGGIDLVLLDYRLPGGVDGLDFYARVKAAGYDIPVILVTGYSSEATVIQALRVGVRDFVTKSLEYLDYLPEAVGRVLRQVGTERRLAESEARLAGVIGSAKDAVIVVEADRGVSLFNPAAERMFGCRTADALGRPITDFIPEGLALTGGAGAAAHGVRYGGQVFPVEATVAPGRAGGREFYTLVVRDVTERKRAEEALRASEERFRLLMDNVPDYSLVMLDPGGHVLTWNGGAERITGYATREIVGRHCTVFYPPEDVAAGKADWALRVAAERGRFEEEGWRVRKDGSRFWAWVVVTAVRDAAGGLQGFAKVTRDLTERKKLETKLTQAQKMEAVGRLAGGVAHDFNNLLTVINGYAEVMLAGLDPDDPNRPLVQQVFEAGERAARLTRQLLVFSRKEAVAPRVVDLNALVEGAGALLRRLIGEDVHLTVVTAPTLPTVRADPGQVEQVLINLAVNARDAMPTGGRLTIETAEVELGEDYARLHPAVTPGRYVMLAVSDTGVGMTEDVLAHLFEPFFTTKQAGKGTGLGLATVYGIVRQWGGHIGVYSEPGRGTVFKVYLPSTADRPTAADPRHGPVGLPGGAETVLLVEDDPAVRGLARLALQLGGYRVLEAADGDEAVRVMEGHAGPIDLLITDVVLPGVGGRVVAERVAERHPGARVLFVSGYTADAVVRHGVLQADVAFLQKPFTPAALARKVREVLDA